MEKELYKYEGPIMEFGNVVVDCKVMYTQAVSEKAAKRNFEYQAKSYLGLVAETQVTIDESKIQLA